MVASRLFSAVIAVALLPMSVGLVFATEDVPIAKGRLLIGSTGIMCVKEPCPRMGIRALDGETITTKRPLAGLVYRGSTLPPLEASSKDRARIEDAWTRKTCVIVEGVFMRTPFVLKIDHVERDPC